MAENKNKVEEQNLEESKQPKSSKKEEILRTLKFIGFSISAGVIQFGLTAILELVGLKDDLHWIAYGIGLVASVLWNFTFNRKFTFKSANNIPVAMTLVALYYAVFTPISVWGDKQLVAVHGWLGLLSTAFFMIINFVTEFLWQRFVVFRNSINSAVSNENEEMVSSDDAASDQKAKKEKNKSGKLGHINYQAIEREMELLKQTRTQKTPVQNYLEELGGATTSQSQQKLQQQSNVQVQTQQAKQAKAARTPSKPKKLGEINYDAIAEELEQLKNPKK